MTGRTYNMACKNPASDISKRSLLGNPINPEYCCGEKDILAKTENLTVY